VRRILTAIIGVLAVLIVLAVVLADRLDTLDKLASIGGFLLATVLAVLATKPSIPSGRWFTRPRRRYLNWLVARNHDIDIRGLSTQGPSSLAVESVFVDVALVSQPAHRITGHPLAPAPEATDRRPVWSFLKSWPPRTLVIVGPPGSGKTTLLKHIALTLAAGMPRSAGQIRRRLPVLLVIRDHAAAIVADPAIPLIRVVMDALPQSLGSLEDWMVGLLDKGRCLIMLDGLDEVPDAASRHAVSIWVERQRAAHHANGFVLTSRPYGYESDPLASADVVRVRPFTNDQITRFIGRWYLATEVRRTGRRDEVVMADAQAKAGELMHRIQDSTYLYDLAVNPLLLTMIAYVHYYRGVLPGGRAQLYREICQAFLGARQAAKGIADRMTVTQRESVLRVLALDMMENRERDVTADEAAKTIAAQLTRVAPSVPAETFLRDTEQVSGLLISREEGDYAFAHLTFQEYLAAARIRELHRPDILVSRINDPWWTEVILLYCATTDAGPIVEACLASTTARTLLLASDCAELAGELHPAIRHRLESKLSAATRFPDSPEAQIVAEVILIRKLRRVRRTPDGTAHLPDPITHAEYATYLRTVFPAADGDESPDPRPLHWSDNLARQAPDIPVTGLSRGQRNRFAAWASDAADRRFKPSTLPEFRAHAFLHSVRTWAREANWPVINHLNGPNLSRVVELLRAVASTEDLGRLDGLRIRGALAQPREPHWPTMTASGTAPSLTRREVELLDRLCQGFGLGNYWALKQWTMEWEFPSDDEKDLLGKRISNDRRDDVLASFTEELRPPGSANQVWAHLDEASHRLTATEFHHATRLTEAAGRLLAAAQIAWAEWLTSVDRDATTLATLVRALYRYVVTVHRLDAALALDMAALLDDLIVLYWQATGRVSIGDELWLRRV
jgi:hypothetical protein